MNSDEIWEEIEDLMRELAEQQRGKMYIVGRHFIPHITMDDLLQPNDFKVLEQSPLFRYEEGVYHGVEIVKSAMMGLKKNPQLRKS